MAVRDIDDFVGRVLAASFMAGKKVTKLVIGSHGSGIDSGYGNFHIGKTVINTDPDDYKMLKQKLWPIRTVLAAHAHVYLLSCRTGKSTALLGGVSDALGGIAVHGFTDYISTLNLYVYTSVDDGTEDGGKEIVCWSNECVEVKTNGLRPFTNR
jgi:hypothetical protein